MEGIETAIRHQVAAVEKAEPGSQREALEEATARLMEKLEALRMEADEEYARELGGSDLDSPLLGLRLSLCLCARARIPPHLANRLSLVHAVALRRRAGAVGLLGLLGLLVAVLALFGLGLGLLVVGIPLGQLDHVVEVEPHAIGVLPVGVVLALRLFVAEAQRVFVEMPRGDVGDADVEGDVFRLEGLHHGELC
ncbi:hypothetical protein Trco_006304 [Trichoderma cornu-damae]|uniref:Uncharacterized protein n=1 Tax=Trichoderma cornu-damae TaxID=654480 RepID=A0A9P8TU05_9HYPO|nr:hypothetical protein Trco_006304 [Trichoderma cornu-damae]